MGGAWELVDTYARGKWGDSAAGGVTRDLVTAVGPNRPCDAILIGRDSEVDRVKLRIGAREYYLTREVPLLQRIEQAVSAVSVWSAAGYGARLELEVYRGPIPAWLPRRRNPQFYRLAVDVAQHATTPQDGFTLPIMGRGNVSLILAAPAAVDTFLAIDAIPFEPATTSITGGGAAASATASAAGVSAAWSVAANGYQIWPSRDPATGLPVEQLLQAGADRRAVDLVLAEQSIAFLRLRARKALGAGAAILDCLVEVRDADY